MTVSTPLVLTGSYQAAGQPALQAFLFHPATGALSPCGEYRGITAPSFLALHPSGRWLYAVSETSLSADGVSGHVHALALERSGDAVTFSHLNARESGGDWPCHVCIDPSGEFLLTTNYGSGSVGVLPINSDGTLGERCELFQHRGHGVIADRQKGPHTHSTIFSPDGAYAIVADLGIDALVSYAVAGGRLSKAGETRTAPGAGPRHMAFHPNGRVLYVTNELNGTLSAYEYAGGRLCERQTLATLPGDAPGNLVADLHVSAAGDRVFVSNRGHNSLAIFAADPEGTLAPLAQAACGGNWPRNFALSPDGRFILVANQYSGEIASLPVQPETGEIGAAVARCLLPKVACVVFA